MALVDVTELLTDPDFAQNFIIWRKGGEWDKGEWISTEYKIKMYGPVQPINVTDVKMLPESDRVVGIMTFWSKKPIIISNEEGLSDELEWRGERYKVMSVSEWSDNGWQKAFGVRK